MGRPARGWAGWACAAALAVVLAAMLLGRSACRRPPVTGGQSEVLRLMAAMHATRSATQCALSDLDRIPQEEGDGAPAMLAVRLHDADPEVRARAAEYLRELARWPMTHAAMRADLVEAVGRETGFATALDMAHALAGMDLSPAERAGLADALCRLLPGAVTPPEVHELVGILDDLGADASCALEPLDRLASSDKPAMRLAALAACVRLGGEADGHLASLARSATHAANLHKRTAALRALRHAGPAAAAAMPAVVAVVGLTGEHGPDLLDTLQAVGSAGGDGVAALAALVRDTDHPAPVRALAVKTLGCLQGDRALAVEALLNLHADLSPLLRSEVLSALGRLGDGGAEVLQVLALAVREGIAEERWEALRALARLRPDAPEVRRILAEAAAGRDRAAAVAAMAELECCGECRAVLLQCLADPSTYVWADALHALARCGPSADLLAAIEACLQRRRGPETLEALRVLQELGPAAHEATPAVERFLAERLDARAATSFPTALMGGPRGVDDVEWEARQTLASIGCGGVEAAAPGAAGPDAAAPGAGGTH
jgi:hypothetical protein